MISGPRICARRIIPARAGFTSIGDRSHTKLEDHPRSRGVYPYLYRVAVHDAGSSPLARGLLRLNIIVRANIGIIPARAGFTSAHNSDTDA